VSNTEIVPAVEQSVEMVHIAARNSEELAAAKEHMVRWFTRKVGEITEELHTVEQAAKYAKDHKWNHAALDGQVYRIRKRRDFYEKILEAIAAGYTIVPDIPVDLFAIRVRRDYVKADTVTTTETWRNADHLLDDEKPDSLPVGEGRYENPHQTVRRGQREEIADDGKKQIVKWTRPADFAEFEFPIIAAHPTVMSATHEAMARRIFDQIGVAPQGRRRGDPLVIGQVCLRQGWQTKTISFIIGWNINLRDI
jgi:hypothetical protein